MSSKFHGGIHPADSKKQTENRAIEDFGIPKQVVIPVIQHIGAPAKPVVKPGDVVRKGQVIAEAAGFVSAPVHASVGGKVVKVEPRPHAIGCAVMSIVIESEGDDAWAEGRNVPRDTSSMDAQAIRQAVQQAGLVGMGGAAFPTHVKLSPPDAKPIDTFILNGAECEPYLTADHRLMLEDPPRILDGAQIAMKALGCSRCLIGIEDNKPDAVKTMREAIAGRHGFTVHALKTHYPQGGEKQLIYALLRREVPSGGLPMDVGVVVQNVGTCAAIADAVLRNIPLIERIVTVAGEDVVNPANFRVRIGTLLSDILERVGTRPSARRLILGGPMTGTALASGEIPVTKGTSGLLVLGPPNDAPYLNCIRCGRCVDVCPVDLAPSRLSVYLEKDMVERAQALNLLDCIECGCCTYICPSRRPIVQQVKFGKNELRKMKAKQGG